MSIVTKGVLLGLLQVAVASSLGAKLLYDRTTLPRVWVKTVPVDPEMPFRGRYVRLQPELTLKGIEHVRLARNGTDQETFSTQHRARLGVEGNRLIASLDKTRGSVWVVIRQTEDREQAHLLEPLAFFIPEHIPDPSLRSAGEELWVEVTVPKKGPPRPVRLGVKRGADDPVPIEE